ITSSLSLRSSFFDYLHRDHRDIHSFPTRRSSDLKRKGPPRRAFPWCVGRDRLERLDLVRLQALLALDDLEGNLLAFLQRLEAGRSEEHTSELQSRENLVCRLLLEKNKKKTKPGTE